MRRKLLIGVLAVAGLALVVAALLAAHIMMSRSMVRHHYVMRQGVPEPYAERSNPLEPTRDNLAAGERLYAKHCAVCHGASGRGDGPAAQSLEPAPPDLVRRVRMGMATDGYLFWTIAEGGVPVDTPMPPFRNVLDERETWQVILYLRRL